MVLFNHSTRELTAKIVYYGPGLCGKTTNLRLLHEKLDPGTTGRLLSLSTAQDRTIYFDLLPVELGNVKGYTVRFQLCTVPGQVFYNETRKLVLKGADGIVFVVDSQWSMLSHNLESFQNLRENMAELGQSLDETAVVVQYNKRDLAGVLSVQALQESLGFQDYPFVESIAADAKGVVETFKLVSKLTFVQLLKRLQRSPDGERLGPDWVSPSPPNSQSTARIPAVGAELLALTSTVGTQAAPPSESPFETTASWPGVAKGEVFGDATVPPFRLDPASRAVKRSAPEPIVLPDADDTFTERFPQVLETEAEAGPAPEGEHHAGPLVEAPPVPERPQAEPETAVSAPTPPSPRAEPEPPPPAPERIPPALEPPPPPPAAAVWAEAFAGLASRVDELARLRAEESARSETLARETREAIEGLPAAIEKAVSALAPAADLAELRAALDVHATETTSRLSELLAESARREEAAIDRERVRTERERAIVDAAIDRDRATLDAALERERATREASLQREAAASDAAREQREEIRGDVERAVGGVRDAVEAIEGRLSELRGSLEERFASAEVALARLEALDGLDAVKRETAETRRLVETRLEEVGSQNRRLGGFLRRALEELAPEESAKRDADG